MHIAYLGPRAHEAERAALATAGCEQWVMVNASGMRALVAACRPGDTVVIVALDRLGPSLSAVVRAIATLTVAGVSVLSLAEALDTQTTPLADVFARLSTWEQARIKAGREAVRPRGKRRGRPPGVDEGKRQAALRLKQTPGQSVQDICQAVGISRNTYYKYVRPAPPPAGPPAPRVMRVHLDLRLQNRHQSGRGKSRSRDEIEDYVLSYYDMEKPQRQGSQYLLSIPYDSDTELDKIIDYDIAHEAQDIAESHRCSGSVDFTSLDDPDRQWMRDW